MRRGLTAPTPRARVCGLRFSAPQGASCQDLATGLCGFALSDMRHMACRERGSTSGAALDCPARILRAQAKRTAHVLSSWTGRGGGREPADGARTLFFTTPNAPGSLLGGAARTRAMWSHPVFYRMGCARVLAVLGFSEKLQNNLTFLYFPKTARTRAHPIR